MDKKIYKIALGGGCHWCTEAVFQSLIGVEMVEQGFVASTGENSAFSEAVIVTFNPSIISLYKLIEIHLYTHNSASNHSMRSQYRSAVYSFGHQQKVQAQHILLDLQKDFEGKIITTVVPFQAFKPSAEMFKNYYTKDPEKPFCKRYIAPKLKLLLKQFSTDVKTL